jgi:hypothetical protein
MPSVTNIGTIADLIEFVRQHPVTHLVQELGPAVLVGPSKNEEELKKRDEWAYHTVTADMDPVTGNFDMFRDSIVLGVKKARRGPFANTVLVGRAETNDVRVPDDSVSKLHARIKIAEDGSLCLMEAGSTNGTWVNGEKIVNREPVAIVPGDQIVFGLRHFKLYQTEKLYDTMKALVQRFAG